METPRGRRESYPLVYATLRPAAHQIWSSRDSSTALGHLGFPTLTFKISSVRPARSSDHSVSKSHGTICAPRRQLAHCLAPYRNCGQQGQC
eukprot:5772056-Amphidinium_carterae.1